MNVGRNWTSSAVRRCFVDYFTGKHGHKWIPSSSVLPDNDPQLLFTSAGMNQFKAIFTNQLSSDHDFNQIKRAVSYQKCIRTGGKHDDLDQVGLNYRHHTFFEMLGNWSFGDYFKKDACSMALKLIVDEFKIPQNQLIITYFGGDDLLNIPADIETKEIWLQLGFPSEHVIPLGKSDNFWEMGETGPCGICSEIHYLESPSTSQVDLLKNCLEIWNIVFIQFEMSKGGVLKPLPKNHVDTGMGLERITAVLNGVNSNYDTDLFRPLIDLLQKETNAPHYQGTLHEPLDISYRIVVDHMRMITVSLVDGLKPATRDAGRHFRKIFRRCYFRLRDEFGIRRPWKLMILLCKQVVDIMQDDYPEFANEIDNACKIVKSEARLVEDLIRKSVNEFKLVSQEMDRKNLTTISGEQTYHLFMNGLGSRSFLNKLAVKRGYTVDWNGFEVYFARHKEKSALGLIMTKKSD